MDRPFRNRCFNGQEQKEWLSAADAFLGLAFIASVAYMDPGNFATNIQGRAKFSYQLLSVNVASNLMAVCTPKEEANQIEKFGDEYREYMKPNGRFLPGFGS